MAFSAISFMVERIALSAVLLSAQLQGRDGVPLYRVNPQENALISAFRGTQPLLE